MTHTELMALADAYARAWPFEQVTSQRKALSDAVRTVVQDAERTREMLDMAFIAHPNLDLDIAAAMKEKPE
jgi:hypothetical protein